MLPFRRFNTKTSIIFLTKSLFRTIYKSSDGRRAAHILCRKAAVFKRKLMPPSISVARIFGFTPEPMGCPVWVKNWIEAEETRAWLPSL